LVLLKIYYCIIDISSQKFSQHHQKYFHRMGNGIITSLSDEQKSVLQVEYESAVAKGVSDAQLQEIMTKKYTELQEVSELPPIDASTIQGQEVRNFFNKGETKQEDSVDAYFKSEDNKLSFSTSEPTIKPAEGQTSTASVRRGSLDKKAFGAREPEAQEKRRSLKTFILGETEQKKERRGSLDNKIQADVGDVSKKVRSRRMSFDPNSVKDEKLKADLANLATSQEELKVDTWESVTVQPACSICNMVFKSETEKEKHMKYSQVHAIHVKQLEDASRPPAPEETPAVVIEDANTSLIYAGHKLFWRTRMNIDVHLFMHVKKDMTKSILEVVIYDNARQLEFPRIYLKLITIEQCITEETIQTRMVDIAKNRSTEELASMTKQARETMLRDEAISAATSSFVLARLIQKDDTVVYEMSTLDNPELNPIISGGISIDPVSVNRRRSIEDAAAFIQDHMDHMHSLSKMSEVARRHSAVIDNHMDAVDFHKAAQDAAQATV